MYTSMEVEYDSDEEVQDVGCELTNWLAQLNMQVSTSHTSCPLSLHTYGQADRRTDRHWVGWLLGERVECYDNAARQSVTIIDKKQRYSVVCYRNHNIRVDMILPSADVIAGGHCSCLHNSIVN